MSKKLYLQFCFWTFQIRKSSLKCCKNSKSFNIWFLNYISRLVQKFNFAVVQKNCSWHFSFAVFQCQPWNCENFMTRKFYALKYYHTYRATHISDIFHVIFQWISHCLLHWHLASKFLFAERHSTTRYYHHLLTRVFELRNLWMKSSEYRELQKN